MKAVPLYYALSIALAGCNPEPGGPHDPIAIRDGSFSPDLADELTSQSQSFARDHGLLFENQGRRAERILTLHNSEIRIEATLGGGRLRIVAVGAVTDGSINLANRYMNEATSIH